MSNPANLRLALNFTIGKIVDHAEALSNSNTKHKGKVLFIAPFLGHACVGLTLQITFTFQASCDDEVPLIMQSKPVPCGPERACSTEYFGLATSLQ